MAVEVTFDDNFVLAQLTGRAVAAGRGRALLPPTPDSRLVNPGIHDCIDLLRKRYGLTPGSAPSPAFFVELQLLDRGLTILGHTLGLHAALKMVERTIEADWIAHAELAKLKRYRDHITHPMRVTAIGWWFLHRSGDVLLRRLAHHYRAATDTYRRSRGIPCDGHDWKAIVEFAWLATGLLHDCAFPLQYRLHSGLHLGEGLPDTLGLFRVPACFLDSRSIRRRLNGSWLAAQSLGLKGRIAALCGSGFKDAHALLGGLHHCLALGRRRLHSLQGLVIQLASRAIITHHDDDDKSIQSDPLAVLLVVCDELQSWQRPFLHREESNTDSDPDAQTIRPLVECFKVTLHKEKAGFVAVQHMNHGERKILRKEPYSWCFEEFSKPRAKLEKLLHKQNWLPPITCSQRRCIYPSSFPT